MFLYLFLCRNPYTAAKVKELLVSRLQEDSQQQTGQNDQHLGHAG